MAGLRLPLLLLSSAVVTSYGSYHHVELDLAGAQEAVAAATRPDGPGVVSAVGHPATAQLMTRLLGIPVPASRHEAVQQPGQGAIVCRPERRLPAGVELDPDQLDQAGYVLSSLHRTL